MKLFACALIGSLIVTNLISSVTADDAKKPPEIDTSKIVGVWSAQKIAVSIPNKSLWEFKPKGRVEVSVPINLGGVEAYTPGAFGKYKIDGNKLTITLKTKPTIFQGGGGKKITYTATITKLTDKEFQTKDTKGKVSEFEKKPKSDKSN